MKQFIDTNIFVYSVDSADLAKRDLSRQLLETLYSSGTACISTQVVQEFYATARRKLNKSPGEAQVFALSLLAFPIEGIEPRHVFRAMELTVENSISIWDALIVISAAESGCEVLQTEDLQHNQMICGVRVNNPYMR